MRRRLITIAAAAVVVVLIGAFAYVRNDNPEGEPYVSPTVNEADLIQVSEATVFFAHQSVGANVLDGIPAVYEANGLPAPPVAEAIEGTASGAGLLHIRIGDNGDPFGKIEAFDAMIRSGLGDSIDVAVLKLCYVDVREGDDVDAIFAAYRDTLAALQEDYPEVTFIAATVPLNTKRGPLGTLKSLLGRADQFGPEHNVVREQLNQMLREEYADSGLLFDVAAIESTSPAGDRITGRYDGQVYYALDEALASDPGHLNDVGATAAATGFLAVVAQALEG